MNNLDESALKLNLLALISQEDEKGEEMLFHNEDEIMEVLDSGDKTEVGKNNKKTNDLNLQDPLAVVWESADGTSEWYIGFFLGKNFDGTLRVNHLTRNTKSHDIWKRERSDIDDIQDVYQEQIMNIEVIGDLFFGKRVPMFVVENSLAIQAQFEENFL